MQVMRRWWQVPKLDNKKHRRPLRNASDWPGAIQKNTNYWLFYRPKLSSFQAVRATTTVPENSMISSGTYPKKLWMSKATTGPSKRPMYAFAHSMHTKERSTCLWRYSFDTFSGAAIAIH